MSACPSCRWTYISELPEASQAEVLLEPAGRHHKQGCAALIDGGHFGTDCDLGSQHCRQASDDAGSPPSS
jgi:hypothetical protein